jgi:Ca2+/Na+ antiporter
MTITFRQQKHNNQVMKDKKFLVLCGLGIVWLAMFVAMLCGAKIHPRVEIMVYVLCVCWFAYWTISTVRDYFRKETPPATPTQPTQTNAKSKKTPKSD